MANSTNWGGSRLNTGGARPGAGRPKSEIPTKPVQFRLREDEIPVMQEFYQKLKAKRK